MVKLYQCDNNMFFIKNCAVDTEYMWASTKLGACENYDYNRVACSTYASRSKMIMFKSTVFDIKKELTKDNK